MNTTNLIAEELAALQRFRADVLSALRRLDEDLATTVQVQAQEMRAQEPDEVLVRRTAGPAVTVFHHPTRSCKRVVGKNRSRDSFKVLRRSVALDRGLKPCTACRWTSLDGVA